MPLGELVRLDHDAVPAIITVRPGALAEPDQHGKVGLLPGVVFGDVVPLMLAIVARFAAPEKPRGLVAIDSEQAYILKTQVGVLSRTPT
jgi:hypothetical protein